MYGDSSHWLTAGYLYGLVSDSACSLPCPNICITPLWIFLAWQTFVAVKNWTHGNIKADIIVHVTTIYMQLAAAAKHRKNKQPQNILFYLAVFGVFVHCSLKKGLGRGGLSYIYLIFVNARETNVFPALSLWGKNLHGGEFYVNSFALWHDLCSYSAIQCISLDEHPRM